MTTQQSWACTLIFVELQEDKVLNDCFIGENEVNDDDGNVIDGIILTKVSWSNIERNLKLTNKKKSWQFSQNFWIQTLIFFIL